MEHKYIYKTKFYFDNKVRNIYEANDFFDNETYLNNWQWMKEDVADWIGKDEANKIIDFTWNVTRKESGCIIVVSTEELSDQALDALSKWIKHKCDELEEDEMLLYYKDVFWYTQGIEIQVHFDHEGSDYKLKLVKVQ